MTWPGIPFGARDRDPACHDGLQFNRNPRAIRLLLPWLPRLLFLVLLDLSGLCITKTKQTPLIPQKLYQIIHNGVVNISEQAQKMLALILRITKLHPGSMEQKRLQNRNEPQFLYLTSLLDLNVEAWWSKTEHNFESVLRLTKTLEDRRFRTDPRMIHFITVIQKRATVIQKCSRNGVRFEFIQTSFRHPCVF